MDDLPTIAALATPSGSSALAVIRVSGSLVYSIAGEVFKKEGIFPRKAHFGKYNSVDGKVLDECVWVVFSGPKSYTGEDLLEISCHGNPFIIKRILGDLYRRGCRPAQPGEFTRRAFLNGKMDLTQAEAVSEIISARSERAFDAARKLLSGELGKRIFEWNEQILSLLAETETQIDFSEDEVPEINTKYFREKIEKLISKLRRTRESVRYSSRVYEGINVVIFGAPNAGKSSLMNVLVGTDRALVSDEAGTTRDFISENIIIDGNNIRLIDTAGIRECTTSKVEESGIRKTLDCIHKADFLIFVIDASGPSPTLSEDILKKINSDNCLILFNKIDLDAGFEKETFLPEIDRLSLCLLEESSSGKLYSYFSEIFRKKNIIPDSDVLIVSSRHAEAILQAENELLEAQELIEKIHIEFISAKLRSALEDLSEILGRFDNEKVLDKVFSSFCIGK